MDEVLRNASRASHDLEPATLERITDSIRLSLRPVRALPPAGVLTAGLVLVAAIVALAGAARAGFFGVEKMDFWERGVIFSTLVIFAWIAGSGFVKEMIPGSRRRISSGAILVLACLTLLGDFAVFFHNHQIDHFFSIGIVCLVTGLLHAVPAGLLCWLLLRRGFAVNPVSAGLMAGTLSGLAGVGMLELHCPNFEVAHLLVWHTAVVPLSGALGAAVAWVLQRCRRALSE